MSVPLLLHTVLDDHDGNQRLAFQLIDDLQRATWPEPGVPKQLHLDLPRGGAASRVRRPGRPRVLHLRQESRGPVPVDVGQHPRQHRADGREVRSPGPRRVGQFAQG